MAANYILVSTGHGTKNIPYAYEFVQASLRQFQSMIAYEFFHHHSINDKSRKRAIIYIYILAYTADFGPLKLDFTA